MGHGIDQYRVSDVEILSGDFHFVHERLEEKATWRWRMERFARMCPTAIELVGAAHVVEMSMGEDNDGISFEQLRQVHTQRSDAEAGIHDEVSVAAAQVPDVGLQQFVDVRFVDLIERRVDRSRAKPFPDSDAKLPGRGAVLRGVTVRHA
jgi:hypothetical protein